MVDCEREVEVRSLTGESMIISISPDRTIEELKLLLKQVFDAVKNSSNFHLFFKGAKMILGNRISSYSIESSDFIVVVLLKKKDRVQTQPRPSTETSKTSSFADSAWNDLMNDLSTLSDLPQDRIQNDSSSSRERDAFVGGSSKRKRGLKGDGQDGFSDEVLNSILCSTSKNIDVLDEDRLEKIIRVSDSANCLFDTLMVNCLFSVNPSSEGTKSC